MCITKRDEIYNQITQLWRVAMKRVWKDAEATIEGTIRNFSEFSWFTLGIESQYSFGGNNKNIEELVLLDDSTMDIQSQVKNRKYQEKFRLPKDEYLLKGKKKPRMSVF